MDIDNQKLMALGTVAKISRIEPYRLARWFYGQTELKKDELEELDKAMVKASDNVRILQARIFMELKDRRHDNSERMEEER